MVGGNKESKTMAFGRNTTTTKKETAKETVQETVAEAPAAPSQQQVDINTLAAAFAQAINIAKPMEKKTPFNRKINTPWTPTDGSPRLKLKRAVHQHGVLLDPEFLSNDEIALFNKLKPGLYLDGYVRVIRRKDRGISLDYPVKTAAQRLRLVNQFGVRNLQELLEKCVAEGLNPKKQDEVDADGDFS
jgi:hypothetical protein